MRCVLRMRVKISQNDSDWWSRRNSHLVYAQHKGNIFCPQLHLIVTVPWVECGHFWGRSHSRAAKHIRLLTRTWLKVSVACLGPDWPSTNMEIKCTFSLKITLFWNMTLRQWVIESRHFERTSCPHFQVYLGRGMTAYVWTLLASCRTDSQRTLSSPYGSAVGKTHCTC